MTHRLRILALTTLTALGSLCAVAAQAGTQTLELVRATLQNVPDAAGTSQYEGGTIENSGGTQLGTYMIVRRTGSATALYNTAATTMTLFFPPSASGVAPNVVTVEGSWSFSSGDFLGSISAASNRFHWIVGADASSTIPSGSTSKLVLTWAGSNEAQL